MKLASMIIKVQGRQCVKVSSPKDQWEEEGKSKGAREEVSGVKSKESNGKREDYPRAQ